MYEKFATVLKTILRRDKFAEENGRKVLTAKDRATMASVGFGEKFANGFEDYLNSPEAEAANVTPGEDNAAIRAVLAQTTDQLVEASAQLRRYETEKKADASTIAALQGQVDQLQQNVVALSELAEPDPAAQLRQITSPAQTQAVNLDDTRQLFGRSGEMYSLDRPYNQRARAAMLARRGVEVQAQAASSIDYGTLNADLGAYYRQAWLQQLQSFLTTLPSCESIFPLESGYQDMATLVNVWLGEMSQADNTVGSQFSRVTKGNYDFGHETLRMYGVMFAHTFSDMAAIEKSWIGHLNREGSDPVKMSFIEYLLTETAKKLHNERELRRINGVRRNPKVNEPGRAMEASDGFYEFIRKKVEGHIDFTPDGGTTGKTVYQIKPFELGEITPDNIGELIYQGTSMIPAHIRDSGNVVCYIPSPLLPWYHKYNEAKYGQNTDYNGKIMTVKEYPSVELVPVPNADNHHRLVWTLRGNVKLFEQRAGEMLQFRIEQQDWTVKVWSNWKESVWAVAVGYKYTDRAKMDGSRQLIWCNEYDRPASFFLEGRPDENPSVVLHSSVKTVANSSQLEITDIEGAQVGQIVAIQCGADGDYGVTIKKAGLFELLSADWTPRTGEVLRLVKRADGKFVEVARETAPATAYEFEPDATAPSVAGATVFVAGVNTKATALADLADATAGVVYTIHVAGEANATTIANGGKFVLTAAMTLKAGSLIRLVKAADGKFYEVSRG